jgi:hypothetical protein
MRKQQREECGRDAPELDVINLAPVELGDQRICARCFNMSVAEADGLDDSQHVDFSPVEVAGREGEVHRFHVRVRGLGGRVALDAIELRGEEPDGCFFQSIGGAEEDLMAPLGQLIERIRRALALRHVVMGKLGWSIADMVVRARVAWDRADDGRAPLLVIDGREFTWEGFGRMMMTLEGWLFKLEIHDKSEER